MSDGKRLMPRGLNSFGHGMWLWMLDQCVHANKDAGKDLERARFIGQCVGQLVGKLGTTKTDEPSR